MEDRVDNLKLTHLLHSNVFKSIKKIGRKIEIKNIIKEWKSEKERERVREKSN